MLHRCVVIACLAALPAEVIANGRPPLASTINFKTGDDQQIAAGMTFGLLLSKDGGATWFWACEEAIGYGGMYDPDYIFAPDGTLHGTTFGGLVANRDGCTYQPTTLGTTFVSTIAIGPTGAIHVAASDNADSKIYTSTDGGSTFPISTMPGMSRDWWETIEVAPSNANVIYLSGFRLVAGQPKVHLLFKSTNGGTSFTPLPVDDFAVMPNSAIAIAGISPTNPNLVFARVKLSDNSLSDTIYRSTDGGTSWVAKLEKTDAIAFVVRGNGDLVAATQQVDPAKGLGAFVSKTNGDTWTPLPSSPHVACLEENAAGEIWACTQNYAVPGVPADGFGIMKTSGDLSAWTGVLRFQDMKGPITCAGGTVQYETCDSKRWCGLCAQLGCDPGRECPMLEIDGAPDAGTLVNPPTDSCCGAGHGGSSVFLGALVGLLFTMPRRPGGRVACDVKA